MQYSNSTNISLALAVMLASDSYDYEPNVISATSLMKSTRSYLLSKRVPNEERVTDISSLVASSIGTAIHDAMEKAWLNNPAKTLQDLGYPKKVYENILVNPTQEQLESNPSALPVYLERRSYADILGDKTSGKFDIIIDGVIQDLKTTSVWTYIYQSKVEDYITQLSIYRYLNQDIVTKDYGLIHYIFTDWSATAAKRTKDYPVSRVLTQKFPLMSVEETEKYVTKRIMNIQKYAASPESELPLCTPKELWQGDTVFKYYKYPERPKAQARNFNSLAEASLHMANQGDVGIIKEVKGEAKACLYCSAISLCSQAQSLITSGELKL